MRGKCSHFLDLVILSEALVILSKAKDLCNCRPSQWPAAKSLFRNILDASPCESRFCEHATGPSHIISNGINILAGKCQTNSLPPYALNSLFYKILHASLFESRFCGKDFDVDPITSMKSIF